MQVLVFLYFVLQISFLVYIFKYFKQVNKFLFDLSYDVEMLKIKYESSQDIIDKTFNVKNC